MHEDRVSSKEFIVAGHSHVFAMGARQAYSGPIDLQPVEVHGKRGYFLMEKWEGNRTPAYWEHLVAQARGKRLIFVFNGNQHMGLCLLAPNPFIDLFDPDWPDEDPEPGATLVPRALMKEYFVPTVRQLEEVAIKVAASGCASIVILGTPPPRANIQELKDWIRNVPFFQRVAERRGIDLAAEDLRVTPTVILKKLWGIVQELMREIAARTGAQFVPVPPEVRDSRGFLLPQYCSDLTHGTAAYGKLMLERAVLGMNLDFR